MKNYVNSVLLPIVAIIVAAAVLFGLNFGLASYRAEVEAKELTAKMQTILPGSEVFTEEAYTGEDANIVATYKAENGYVVETCAYGYAGDITMLIGVSNEGTVTGLQVRDMSETQGLGGEALWNWEFLIQFLNNAGDAEIGTNVDGLTGATVTSKAIARSVNSAVGFVTGADVESSATSWGG